MGIINRSHDASERKDWLEWSSSSGTHVTFGNGFVPTGQTLALVGPMPYPYQIQSIAAVTNGASGAPQLAFGIIRGVSGAAQTFINIGISNFVVPNSASGFISASWSGMAAASSTLLVGNVGDVIYGVTAVSNTAFNSLAINIVVKRTQDIVSYNGIAT